MYERENHADKKENTKRKCKEEKEQMKKENMSCIDCAVKNCNKMDKTYPDFCLTTHMDEEV